jgi:hypothetical protein
MHFRSHPGSGPPKPDARFPVFDRLGVIRTYASAELVFALHELEKNLIASETANMNLGLFDCA